MAKKNTPKNTTPKSTAPQIQPSQDWTPWILMAAAFFIYAMGFAHPLVEMDDYSATRDNPAVVNFAPFTNFNLGMYAPLTWLFYGIAYQLEGGAADKTPDSAFWYHILSALVHAASTCFVFLLMKRGGLEKLLAAGVALLFAIHPIQVESVAWVAGFSTPLYGMFVLSALLLYQRFVRESHEGVSGAMNWYYLAIGMMLLGCLSKSSAVITPLLLIVLDLWNKPHYQSRQAQLMAYAPFFGLALAFGLLTLYSRSGIDLPFGIRNEYSGIERLFLVAYAPIFYIYKTLLPLRFNVYYAFEKINNQLPVYYYLAPVMIAGLAWAGWKFRKTIPLIGIGLLFFIVNHLVTLPLAPVGSFELCADHYNYLACIGLFIALAGVYQYIANNNKNYQSIANIVIFVFIAFSTIQTLRHLRLWRDVVSLINNAIDNGYDSYGKTYFWRGSALAKTGKSADIAKAIQDFTKAIEMDSSLTEAYKYRGGLYGVTGKFALSVQDINKYLSTQPADSTDYRYNRGLSYLNMGKRAEAMADMNRVIAADPNFYSAFRARGNLYYEMGDTLRGNADIAEFERLAGRPDPARADKILKGGR
jgi:protein O-mannosyl-transferase